MSYLPSKPIDAFDLFDMAVRRHMSVFKRSYALIILITLAQAFAFYFGQLFSSLYVNALFEIIGMLFFLYFSGAMLLLTQSVLEGHDSTVKNALREMAPRFLPFFLGLLCVVVVVILYYLLITHLMQIWVKPQDAHHLSLKNVLIFIFLCLAPIVVFIVFMIFTLPLIAIDRMNPLKAMRYSHRIIATRWLQAFTIYACVGIIYILVSPATLHAHFFMHYHLFMVFVFLIYCILLPLLFNYLLLMMNDFKLRMDKDVDFE